MIENYNCKKAFIRVSKEDYLEDLELGQKSIETAKKISNYKDFENAYIILYRGLQLIGNAYLIKKYSLKSKSKNCQFQYLYDEGDLSSVDLAEISKFSEIRNNVYYNNVTIFSQLEQSEYEKKFKAIMKIIDKFMEEL